KKDERFAQLKMGLTFNQILDKFFFQNAFEFMSRYFKRGEQIDQKLIVLQQELEGGMGMA
ncbi:MAG: hypothetical protein ACPGJS_20435, partial [Flammeovirgaceae bacterium]